jgi:lysozyme
MTPEGLLQLKGDEGFRTQVYDDASGKTIETGPAGGWPTIGYGRNLVARGITQLEATYLLNNDIALSEGKLATALSFFTCMAAVWQDVCVMVDYNTGNVLAFQEMLAAMRDGNAEEAAAQLLNSKAAKEGPARYNRMAVAITANAWGTPAASV